MKGADPLIVSIMLIGITVVAAGIISGWSSNFYQTQGQELKNQTESKLSCQLASFYVRNISISCNNNCFTGSPYRVNASIENTGDRQVDLSRLAITLSNGITHIIYGNKTTLSSGITDNKAFNSILISGSPKMPIQSMDSMGAYSNDTNTVALWHFDQATASSTLDNSRGNNLTCYGMGTNCSFTPSGKYGGALTFNGSDQYLNASDSVSLNMTNQVTVEAWVYANSTTGGNAGIVAKGTATSWPYAIIYDTNANINCIIDGSTNAVSFSMLAGSWHHVALSYNGTDMFCYMDGILKGSKKINSAINQTASNVMIGRASVYFNGTIDEVRISNFSRNFNTTLTINVTHPGIKFVRLFNSSGLVSQSTNQNGVSVYNTQYENLKTYNNFRVEVEDTSGFVISKWYPYDAGGACVPVSNINRIRFAADNCPSVTDAYFGSDVYYENCA
ncbi:MAG: LamG domain-containing protein [Candidatus Aenigmarchaeota archaeon]|nr:LamG domain-containing protein [Candidatus Aenigmarchaeota archaeon]